MLHIVLGFTGLTIRVSGSLIPQGRTGTLVERIKSRLRYLEAMPEQLIGVTRSVNI